MSKELTEKVKRHWLENKEKYNELVKGFDLEYNIVFPVMVSGYLFDQLVYDVNEEKFYYMVSIKTDEGIKTETIKVQDNWQ